MTPSPAGITVILTREPRHNAALKTLLEPLGVDILEYPCIRTERVDVNPRAVREALEGCIAAAFTSARAVEALANLAPLFTSGTFPMTAVGDATARALERVFRRKPELTARVQTGEALAGEMIPWLRATHRVPGDGHVVHFRGNRVNPVFRRKFLDARIPFRSLIVYETHPAELAPLPEGRYVPVLCSPSAARNFFQVNPPERGRLHPVAVGPVTAKAVEELIRKPVTVPETPAAESLARAVRRVVDALVRGENGHIVNGGRFS